MNLINDPMTNAMLYHSGSKNNSRNIELDDDEITNLLNQHQKIMMNFKLQKK